MVDFSKGNKAELYLQLIIERLGNMEAFSLDFNEATEQEWQDCLLCFDNIDAAIKQLDKHMFNFLKKGEPSQ